ncbi:aminotransferase class I/II-fold pyridoxal phosphate-dependent enzyme [Streptomyces sp. NPDC048191]|uniref:aminotransferase class I/II-fold pyridoxal phosphate-dependent enzyme n=1 Tax=Streptomyces sp. NPDC048191 TaxID=3155484 RepID=UPI003405F8D6
MTRAADGTPPRLSHVGDQMSRMSGLRALMEDIAASTAGDRAGEWLNLGIGNPAVLPAVTGMWRRLTWHAHEESFADAGQYGPSRGAPVLVRAIADYFRSRLGWRIGSENIVVSPGSQMLCFVAAAVFAGPGSTGTRRVLLPMTPDYTGYQGLCMVPGGVAGTPSLPVREEGRLFSYVLDLDAVARHPDPGMLLLSSPGNPTGRALSPAEQDGLIEIAERLDVPLFVDHAYGRPFPQIGPTQAPPVLHPNVVNCFSMSKLGLPGERIGFAIGPERFITPIVSCLSNSVLHTPRLAQAAVAAGLRSGAIDDVVSTAVRPFYLERRLLVEKLLSSAMPPGVDWRLHANEGGMFAWVWVDEDWFDDLALYDRLKEQHVFIAPGRSFFTGSPRPGEHGTRCFRITLSVDEDVLREGIRRIGRVIGQAGPRHAP